MSLSALLNAKLFKTNPLNTELSNESSPGFSSSNLPAIPEGVVPDILQNLDVMTDSQVAGVGSSQPISQIAEGLDHDFRAPNSRSLLTANQKVQPSAIEQVFGLRKDQYGRSERQPFKAPWCEASAGKPELQRAFAHLHPEQLFIDKDVDGTPINTQEKTKRLLKAAPNTEGDVRERYVETQLNDLLRSLYEKASRYKRSLRALTLRRDPWMQAVKAVETGDASISLNRLMELPESAQLMINYLASQPKFDASAYQLNQTTEERASAKPTLLVQTVLNVLRQHHGDQVDRWFAEATANNKNNKDSQRSSRLKSPLLHGKLMKQATTDLAGIMDRYFTLIDPCIEEIDDTVVQQPVVVNLTQRQSVATEKRTGSAEVIAGLGTSSRSAKGAQQQRLNNALISSHRRVDSDHHSEKALHHHPFSAIRSARTVTPEAVESLVILNIHKAANDGRDLSQPLKISLFSALDGLSPKGGVAIPGVYNPRKEMAMFEAIQGSIAEIWGDQSQVEFTVEMNGQERVVMVERPMLLNMVLSSKSANTTALIKAREHNRQYFVPLLNNLCDRYLVPTYGKSAVAPLSTSAKLRALVAYAKKTSDPTLFFAVKALKVMNSYRALLGKKDPLKEFALMHFLMRAAGVEENYQCKSGLDRTPAMLCMAQSMELLAHKIEESLSTKGGDEAEAVEKSKSDLKKAHFQHMVDAVERFLNKRYQQRVDVDYSEAINTIFTKLMHDSAFEPTMHSRDKPHLKNNEHFMTKHYSTNAHLTDPKGDQRFSERGKRKTYLTGNLQKSESRTALFQKR